MPTMILVNLPVADLPRSVRFFRTLGYDSDPDFSDESAVGMAISPDIYAMLLTHDRFRQYTPKAICDTATHTEVLVTLRCESRAAVDEMVGKAVAAGGATFAEPIDFGSLYSRSFTDLDGHIWEVLWMDPAIPATFEGGGEAKQG